MKTMGLSDLVLVRPKSFPDDEATARATGADDILVNARVVTSLAGAIDDCTLVFGASARVRGGRWPVVDPAAAATEIVGRMTSEVCAIVMGPEQSGLTNEDLARCQSLVYIPTSPDFGSLNIAMAVQVLCYELRMKALAAAALDQPRQQEQREATLATAGELEGMHEHMEDLLERSGFLHPDHPRQLKRKLRRLFVRADLDQSEINILRGMLSSLDPDSQNRG